MNIRRIIKEEVDEFEWASNIKTSLSKVLDIHFGLYFIRYKNTHSFGHVNLIHSKSGNMNSFTELSKTSVRELYEIVTEKKWYKNILTKEYREIRKDLKEWLDDRIMKLSVTSEVQNGYFH
jgi:hypothetical protein